MPVFAQQIKQYASLAPTLRPDNAVKDFVAIVVNMERTKARKVQPDGTYTSITIAEADTY
ncbi:MAG: hypothetical protein LBP53_05375 [Candidatus Peribacteria bacterium]|jgi:hypothetical protein|nr:hypothetical protein [Candidatus Peribacteria bacterium]